MFVTTMGIMPGGTGDQLAITMLSEFTMGIMTLPGAVTKETS